MMPPPSGPRPSFFPSADAAVLQSKYEPPRVRPKVVAPAFDLERAEIPLAPWALEAKKIAYPQQKSAYEAAPIPDQPAPLVDQYLHPILTQNERLRLTMLWYYTRNILEDTELLSRLQDKVHLIEKSIGWEFVIIGLLDVNSFTRLVTVGIPLAILPRRESTCSHTVNVPPGVRLKPTFLSLPISC